MKNALRSSACAAWLLACLAQSPAHAAESKPLNGLALSVRSGDAIDWALTPNAWLQVPAGQSPTPFLPAGAFTAVWEGQISVELRAEFAFHAVANGALKIEANGAVALETGDTKGERASGKPVRLSKGANNLKITYTSPADGAANVRVFWSSDDFAVEPIDSAALRFTPTAEFENAAQRLKGRELFLELRCVRCHTADGAKSPVPELGMDAPALDGIGSRRKANWMARWIANPESLRPGTPMPAALHGPTAAADAEAIAAFLGTLKTTGTAANEEKPGDEAVEKGKKLFEALHCVACHEEPGSTDKAVGKISLKQVNEKFSPGALAAFLRAPQEHFQWIRMPNFRFTVEESANLAAFLRSAAPAPADTPTSAAFAEKGRELLQSKGCLNCHTAALPTLLKPPALSALKAGGLEKQCLADDPASASAAPRYTLSAADRSALRAFLSTDRESLSRHVPAEFAERHTRQLNCNECHGKFEGFPALPMLGGKLKPEWMRSFIGGEVAYKPRTWIESRMPGFKAYAEGMAHGLAQQHGYPAKSKAEPAVDEELAKTGRKLVSSDGGFSCISCHGVGAMAPTQVFESVGINLAFSGERLQPDFFHRWLSNPLRIDPQTKMPVYFDQGKSPLTDVLEGDGFKQQKAIWHYLLQGSKMVPPIANAEPAK